jgi:hypothetical protein
MSAGKKDGFTALDAEELQCTLAQKLIPVADKIRDLHTQFGGRPYIVRIIRTRWTGSKRGVGSEHVMKETTITPTPLVVSLDGLQETLTPVGLNEYGSLQVTNISGRYTEEQLRGFDKSGNGLPSNEQLWWEIEFPRVRDGKPGVKRRFAVRSAPNYSPYSFQWSVSLDSVDERRNRQGEP